ncbi:unnamed protein product [Schistocephalus solidus]|uniref:LSM14 domain-containing protein n=1 Tax=Schistocephalus solidus TaxID=70667 RepID=A0A183SNN5_SCHSO|nr:unnamed protein product [Schistocephalus solidus]
MTTSEVPQLSKIPIGANVSLITSVQYRYEGTVAAINSIEDTITLRNVRFWGAENRVPATTSAPSSENKGPAIGSLFDSVTFWMSNVIKLRITDEVTDKNELTDVAVKTASTTEPNKAQAKKPPAVVVSSDTINFCSVFTLLSLFYSWIYFYLKTQTTDSASSSRNSNRASRNGRTSRTGQPSVPQTHRQSRPFIRRGRNGGPQRQPPLLPFATAQTLSATPARNAYLAPVRGASYRVSNNGRQNGMGRRPGPSGSNGRRSYPPSSGNGGVFVYLPPEVAAAYQPHALTILPQQVYNGPVGGGRRGNSERRGGPSRVVAAPVAPEVDCSVPYDFETANAELEAELAKINLNAENSDEQDKLSSGDRSVNPTSVETGAFGGTASGSGASGDSSSGTTDVAPGTTTEPIQTLANINICFGLGIMEDVTTNFFPLFSGEYYVREKCFFDQISRSEGGPRGPTSGARGNGNGERGRFNSFDRSRPNHGFSMSTARRELQLNIETFGQMAARRVYNQRRRPNGNVPRDLLVSATA